ncbi:MAG: ABC transporter permease [Chitinophagales bacterium]|nr:ABC transporter permease [Chitinophagales bacterium]
MSNYFKIAIRNLLKYKFTSFINLFGLTVGLTCCLLILAFILNELSFDRYNKNAGQIYRVTRSFNNSEGIQELNLSSVAPPFGPLLKNDFPDIEDYTRLLPNGPTPFRYKEKIFNEPGSWYADRSLFHIFTVNVLQGDPETALNDPFCVMLTPDEARKYFGSEDPMNKVMRLNNTNDLKVTGIYQPFPAAAHIHPEILISFPTLEDSSIYGINNLLTNYGNNSFFTYIKLPENYPAEKIANQFPAFIDRHMKSKMHPELKQSKYTALSLQKLTDIHLRSHLDDEAEQNGDITIVYIFAAISLFILLIACINYMNLSTARSALRSREIGVRKVIGAQRGNLITQFLFESVLLSWTAMLCALLMTILVLPVLNQVTGQLSLPGLLRWWLMIVLFITPFIVGVLAGIYPALYLSSFQPIIALKGIFKPGTGSISFRKVLVVVQFTISIILIISTAIVFRQLNYVMKTAPGFDKDQVVTMTYNYALDPSFEAFKSELLRHATIKDATRSSRIPTGRLLDDMGAQTISADSTVPVSAAIKYVAVDYGFIPTYGIKMVAGRNFSPEYPKDTDNYILNEAAIKMLGWQNPKNAIGKAFKYGNVEGKVVGVMKDFHFESMHQPIVPVILIMGTPVIKKYYGSLSVKLSANNTHAGLNDLREAWNQFLPGFAFDYTFLDNNFSRLYDAERKQEHLFTLFSIIAILIACLGLLGLSSFTILQRFKEIGIRKVLGASVSCIVRMLSYDFLKLVIVAALISFPIGWYAMNEWLKGFAYRTEISWWIFPVAALLASFIAFATISIQSIRAAISNPVKNLRTE